jgi:hypothetical protein
VPLGEVSTSLQRTRRRKHDCSFTGERTFKAYKHKREFSLIKYHSSAQMYLLRESHENGNTPTSQFLLTSGRTSSAPLPTLFAACPLTQTFTRLMLRRKLKDSCIVSQTYGKSVVKSPLSLKAHQTAEKMATSQLRPLFHPVALMAALRML